MSSNSYGTKLTQVRSYSCRGAAYSFTSNDFYIDCGVQTPGGPLGDGTRYGPPTPVGYGALEAIDFYGSTRTRSSGSASSSASDSVTTERSSSGDTASYHSASTPESYGGHAVPGTGTRYGQASLTDPSGDTVPFTGSPYDGVS